MTKLSLLSPAKVNLFLRILRRRPDGFHELASLFQTISLFDTLHITLSDKDELTCTIVDLPIDSSNLILKAAALFRRKTGLQTYATVHLEKHIPMEAGLGGGSSNAATMLWALNELTGRPASLQQLQAWGAQIGSDVAFFLTEGTAYCTGRGECLQPLPALPGRELTIVKPLEGLSTPRVFGALNVSSLPSRDPEAARDSWLRGIPVCFNDLEEPAFNLMPSLRELKQSLQNESNGDVLMSGSGTSLFCLGAFEQRLPGVNYFQARFVNRCEGSWYAGAFSTQRHKGTKNAVAGV